MSTILDIRNATVTYQDGETTTTALADASLIAESNTLTAIVGESGSGKSTLLSVAAGLITPDSGSVHVDGTRSIIFQQANLLSSLNVRDQLVIMDHIAGRKLRPQRADELLEFVGLAGMGNRRMGQLSGGQRQRVNIARALMERPDLLLADEPTSALDSHLSQEIIRLLRDVTQEMNTATVLVTHDRSLLNFADRVVEVKDGHVSEQEKVIGRSKHDDIEMSEDEKPANSHSAITNIGDDFKVIRDNMPFGTVGNNELGTYFICYASTFSTVQKMLKNMFMGVDGANYDRLLDFSTAVTGTLFFVPTVDMLGDFAG